MKLYLVYERTENYYPGTPDPDVQHETLKAVCTDRHRAFEIAVKLYYDIYFNNEDSGDDEEIRVKTRDDQLETALKVLSGDLTVLEKYSLLHQKCADKQYETDSVHQIVIDLCETDNTDMVSSLKRISD